MSQKLLDRIEQLEHLLGVDSCYEQELLNLLKSRCKKFPPTRTTAKMVGFLTRRAFASREAIYMVLYGDRNECDQPDIKMIDQIVWRARQALKPHGIRISTEWNVGYSMTVADKKKLKNLLERNSAVMPDPRDHHPRAISV